VNKLPKKKHTIAFVYCDEQQAFETAAMLTAKQASEVEEYLRGFLGNSHISDVHVFEPANIAPHATKTALMRELADALQDYR
jgi:hypothetical protein